MSGDSDAVDYSGCFIVVENFNSYLAEQIKREEEQPTKPSAATLVSFYKGDTRLPMLLPEPQNEQEAAVRDSIASIGTSDERGVPTFTVISMHRSLLLPSPEAPQTQEGMAYRCRLLEANWKQLIPILAPSFVACPNCNGEATLSVAEREALCADASLMDRVHYSYTIILQYFGWRIFQQDTFELDRHTLWRDRYELLQRRPGQYNFLTYFLRSLLDFRLHQLSQQVVRYLVEEFSKGRLNFLTNAWRTCWFEMAFSPCAVWRSPHSQSTALGEDPEVAKRDLAKYRAATLRRFARVGEVDSD